MESLRKLELDCGKAGRLIERIGEKGIRGVFVKARPSCGVEVKIAWWSEDDKRTRTT